jgi:hypothetical protein
LADPQKGRMGRPKTTPKETPMTDTAHPHAHATHSRLAELLDLMPAALDPDFDEGSDELERQFAEIRVTLGHN